MKKLENTNVIEMNEKDLENVSGGGLLAGATVFLLGGALTLIGGKHTIKRIKNEASCMTTGESVYPDNVFYSCK